MGSKDLAIAIQICERILVEKRNIFTSSETNEIGRKDNTMENEDATEHIMEIGEDMNDANTNPAI